MLTVGGDRARWIVNSRSLCGEREHLAPLKQPDKPGLVAAGQPAKTGFGVLWDGDQAEQVPGRPAEGVRLVPPAGQKRLAVGNDVLPAVDADELGAARLKGGDCAAIGVPF